MFLLSVGLYVAMIIAFYTTVWVESRIKHEKDPFVWVELIVVFFFWPCFLINWSENKMSVVVLYAILIAFHYSILSINHFSVAATIILLLVTIVWAAATGILDWFFAEEGGEMIVNG